MAEGNNFLCEPCEQKTTVKSATMFCTDCGVGYCDDCVKIHQEALPLRTHYLTSITNYTKIAPFSGLYICSEHQELYEFVCQQHDVVLCLKCVQIDHTKCDISGLSEASKGVKASYAVYNIEADVNNIIKNLQKSVKTVNDHINNLKSKHKTIKESVDVMYVNSDKEKDNALRDLKFKFKKCLEELHKSRLQFEEKLQNMRRLLIDFSALKMFSSEKQTYIGIKRISQEVYNEKQAVKKMFEVFQIFWLNCKTGHRSSGVNPPRAIDITTQNHRLQFTDHLQQAQIDKFLFPINYKRKRSFNDYLAVIGIEIGQNHTELGMKFKGNRFNELAVYSRSWESPRSGRVHRSPQTCILLKKEDKSFVAFGHIALDMYNNFVENREGSDYHFFNSIVSRSDMSIDSELSDTEGNTLPATDVITLVITELIRSVFDEQGKYLPLTLKDCIWVFTMPSQWTDKGKELLEESAYMSGIPRSNVITVLRPEAALVCFHYQGLSKETESFTITNDDTCLVVDIEGECIEIASFKRESEELIRVDCFPTTVQSPSTWYTQNILKLLETVFGKNVMTKLSKEYQTCYVDLLDTISLMGFLTSLTKQYINMRIPVVALNYCCLELLQSDIYDVFKSSKLLKRSVLKSDVLRFDKDLIIPIFETGSRHTIQEIRKVLHRLHIKTFTSLVLVGEYSDNDIIQHEMKLAFPDVKLLTEERYKQAVIQGAVLFGHKPDVLAQDINHYIYG